jgi:uncharacterized cupin superfamily protein
LIPETAGSHHVGYRISIYRPNASADKHGRNMQEQVYHVSEGEGLARIDGKVTSCASTISFSFRPARRM